MDIYQEIWNADMRGNGVKPVLKEEDGNHQDGFVVVNELENGTDETKLFLKVVIPEHKKGTYELCKKLFNNYTLSPNMPEINTPEEGQEINDFILAIIGTEPMKVVRRWLEEQTNETYNDLRFFKLIYDMWFTQFTQGSGKDLSAFEHIIVGEQKGGNVSGYHFWYKYYLDDSNSLLDKDTIKYKGLKGKNQPQNKIVPEVSTISYSWDAFDYQTEVYRPLFKKIGGFFNGCSPEGLMALGTVRCALQGRAPKEAVINNARYNMKLYRSSDRKNLRTFYPEFIKIVGDIDGGENHEPVTVVVTTPESHVESVTNHSVKIIAALVNPIGHDEDKETVTLFNVSPNSVNIRGWKLVDKNNNKFTIVDQSIESGTALQIVLPRNTMQMSNKGGIIKLLDQADNLVHSVNYTKKEAEHIGWTINF